MIENDKSKKKGMKDETIVRKNQLRSMLAILEAERERIHDSEMFRGSHYFVSYTAE